MINLVIDIGNSRVKAAAIEAEGGVIQQLEIDDDFSEGLQRRVSQMIESYSISRAIISSTRGEQSDVVEFVKRSVSDVIIFTPSTPIPIEVNYATPNTLGRDRLAAAIGAREVYGEGNMLLIDCGTAITIDLYTTDGGFEGGYISPGISMRFKALKEQTATLPLCNVDSKWDQVEIARTTQEAIIGGVMRGVIYEIEGHIEKFSSFFDEISIIFIGGGAKYFDKQIKNAIFADRNLVIVGLNRILLYNV